MTTSTAVASAPTTGTQHPTLDQSVAPRQAEQVSDNCHFASGCMSAGERALRIGLQDSLAKHHEAEWRDSGCFAALGRAHWHELRRDALKAAEDAR